MTIWKRIFLTFRIRMLPQIKKRRGPLVTILPNGRGTTVDAFGKIVHFGDVRPDIQMIAGDLQKAAERES